MNDFTAQELTFALREFSSLLNKMDQPSIHEYFQIMKAHTAALEENTHALVAHMQMIKEQSK